MSEEIKDLGEPRDIRIFTFDEMLLYLLKEVEANGGGSENSRDMIRRLEEGESLWHTLF